MEFGTTLNSQNFGGYSDWRLPTIKELSSLIDSNIPVPGPSINTFYFPNTNNSSLSYWSAIPCVADTTRAWIVSFYESVVNRLLKSNGRFLRAVHGGENGSSGDFIDNGDGTATDNDKGLIWQKDTAPGIYNWQQALYYCDNLILGGHDDWRLPDRNELQTLVDYSRYNPSIDTGFFSNTEPGAYWSSTTKAGSPWYAWIVHFDRGAMDARNKSEDYGYSYLRCVRNGALIDSDADGIPEDGDNCPYNYNPIQFDCDNDGVGDICDADTIDPDGDGVDIACDNCLSTSNPDQLDSYPPGGNGCGDACECEGNFDGDLDVDGSDAGTFKKDFGRSKLINPCTNVSSCNGDFECDADVDGFNASQFKQDFGRSKIVNPCPSCTTDSWCVYP
jgi:hypothetical protein